eukprot:694911-Rhodomonas_salina.1
MLGRESSVSTSSTHTPRQKALPGLARLISGRERAASTFHMARASTQESCVNFPHGQRGHIKDHNKHPLELS